MSTNTIAQGLLSNPMFGLGIGLLGGADPGGTFGSGAQAGLQNMMLMQGQNQRNAMQDLQMKRMQAQLAEDERNRTIQEAMRAQTPAWLGSEAQEAQTAPYMQSDAELFPGEQPLGGLMAETPAQPATGLRATNPQMAGILSDMHQMDPLATQQMVAESMLDSKTRPFGFNDYMSATPEQRALYDQYKGWGQIPSAWDVYERYSKLDPRQKKEFRDSQRAPQWLDYGPGFVDPNAPAGAPTLDPSAPPAPAEPGAPPPQPPGVIEKDIIGEAVATAEGGDIAGRLVSFPEDVRVAEDLLLDIEETQLQLANLFDMTSYDNTGVASYLKALPATEARKWENLKTTIQSRMGLGKMMELKAASSTGSTGFGALNASELKLLVSNLGALDQATDPEDIKAIIISINRQLGNKSNLIRQRIDSKRTWYEENRGQLSSGGVDTGEVEVLDWDEY